MVRVNKAAGGTLHTLTEPGQAVDIARHVETAVREARDLYRFTGRIHFFMAGPVGLAMMIGQLLNTLGPVQTYEHVAAGGVGYYQPAVLLEPSY